MKLAHVDTLVAIDAAGSILGAAELLGKSQPAVTKALRQAEEGLGFAVFHRTTRGVTPTEMGAQVLTRARSIHSEMQRLSDEARQMQGDIAGTLHVGLSPLAAVEIMPPALVRFRKRHPKVIVRLSSAVFPGANAPLRKGLFDLIIGPEPEGQMRKGLQFLPLFETEVVVISGETSPFRHATSLEDLDGADWIGIGVPGGAGRSSILYRSHGRTPPVPMIVSENYLSALSMVETGAVIGSYPAQLLPRLRGAWKITEIALKERLAPVQISVTQREGDGATPALRALIDEIERSGLRYNSEL